MADPLLSMAVPTDTFQDFNNHPTLGRILSYKRKVFHNLLVSPSLHTSRGVRFTFQKFNRPRRVQDRRKLNATRSMLTYMRLIIREALRHGGGGWQEYNRRFRLQVTTDRLLWRNTLLPDLQAPIVHGQGGGGGSNCSLCRGVDHSAVCCFVIYL